MGAAFYQAFHGIEGEEEGREDRPLWGPGVTDHSASQVMTEASNCIAVSFSPSRAGLMVLKALEKSKNMTLTVLVGLSRWA